MSFAGNVKLAYRTAHSYSAHLPFLAIQMCGCRRAATAAAAARVTVDCLLHYCVVVLQLLYLFTVSFLFFVCLHLLFCIYCVPLRL